jgi:hypothetical protein
MSASIAAGNYTDGLLAVFRSNSNGDIDRGPRRRNNSADFTGHTCRVTGERGAGAMWFRNK